MSIRQDYIRVLEIFLRFKKINGRRLIPMTEFLTEFDAIFMANDGADEILSEMEHLDLIEEMDCDHMFGEAGMEMLDKGWEILKTHRKME